MRIKFDKADGIYYAYSENEEYQGYLWTELLWGEITESLGAFRLNWNDHYDKPEFFDTLNQARSHVQTNWNLHIPVKQGRPTPVTYKDEE